jgi:hypothetical protein
LDRFTLSKDFTNPNPKHFMENMYQLETESLEGYLTRFNKDAMKNYIGTHVHRFNKDGVEVDAGTSESRLNVSNYRLAVVELGLKNGPFKNDISYEKPVDLNDFWQRVNFYVTKEKAEEANMG